LRDSLTGTVPTYSKMQLFNGTSTAGVRSVKILKTNHPPYPMLSFWRTRIIAQTFAKSSTFYLLMPIGSIPSERSFSALRRRKQWNRTTMVEDRLKRISITAHSQRRNVDRVKILDKFDTGNRRIGALHL